MKDLFKFDKTTAWGIIGSVAGFVAYAPELFPDTELWGMWVRRIAGFIAMGGMAKALQSAKDKDRGSDRPQEMVDAKLDRIKPFDGNQTDSK